MQVHYNKILLIHNVLKDQRW